MLVIMGTFKPIQHQCNLESCMVLSKQTRPTARHLGEENGSYLWTLTGAWMLSWTTGSTCSMFGWMKTGVLMSWKGLAILNLITLLVGSGLSLSLWFMIFQLLLFNQSPAGCRFTVFPMALSLLPEPDLVRERVFSFVLGPHLPHS